MAGCDLPNSQNLGNHNIDFQYTTCILPKQLINSEAAIIGVVPDSFGQRLQLLLRIARPFKTRGQPLEQRVGVRCRFLEIVKLIAMPHGGNKHVVWRLIDLHRLQAFGNWLHPGGEGKTPGNIVTQKELPECFLAGELLKLAATQRAALKIEGRQPLIVFVQHLKLAGLPGTNDGLIHRNQIEVRQAAAQFLRSARSLSRTHLMEASRHLLAQEQEKRRDSLRNSDEILTIETLQADDFLGPRRTRARHFAKSLGNTENIPASNE